MSRRGLAVVLLCLLAAGAVVNVLVAWAAASSSVTRDPDWYYRTGMTPFPASGFDEVQRDFIVEAWEMFYTTGRGEAVGALDAPWPASPPESWPDNCLRVMWSSRWATWAIGYQMAAGADERELTAYMLDTYRVGWPLPALELRSWHAGPESELAPETLSGFDGLPAPSLLTDLGIFEGGAGRIPVRPIVAGFAANTLFYTAILALPLGFFPVRRWVRGRRGQCAGCGYDMNGLSGVACPECGKAPA